MVIFFYFIKREMKVIVYNKLFIYVRIFFELLNCRVCKYEIYIMKLIFIELKYIVFIVNIC